MTVKTTSRYDRIQQTLNDAFAPLTLHITDESAQHAHHKAQIGVAGGETHYHVEMVSAAMAGLSRVARQRAVNEALAEEFKSGLHALSLTLRAPSEAG